MSTVAYTASPGAPHYIPPTMRLYHGSGPQGAYEIPMLWAKPLQVHWRPNGQVSTMDIRYVLGQGAGGKTHHFVEDRRLVMAPGDRIRLVDTATGTEWFRGYASQRHETIQAQRDEESVQWTIVGPEQLLAGKLVEGQWRKTETADDERIAGTLTSATAVRSKVYQTSLPCIFNQGGKPNATDTTVEFKLDSAANWYAPSAANNDCLVFEPWGREQYNSAGQWRFAAEHWDVYTALRSVIEWVDRYDVIDYAATNWVAIAGMMIGAAATLPGITDVNIQGKSLLDAMSLILNPAGFGFCLEPWAQASGKHRLIVFSTATPSTFKRPNLGPQTPVGVTTAAGKAAVVQRMDFAMDSHNVANEIIVHGDYKRVQVALDFGGGQSSSLWDIKPFWNTTTHAISNWYNASGKFANQDAGLPKIGGYSFMDCHHPDGSQFAQYRDVYRTFTWNEDGHAVQFGWDIPSMAGYGLEHPTLIQASRTRRPMGPTLTYDTGDRIGASVWMAMVAEGGGVDADSWIRLPATPSRERCAFTIRQSCLVGTDKMPWFPWKGASKQGTGASAGYDKYTFMELLHNTITNSGSGQQLVIRFVGTVAADWRVRGVGTSVAGGGAPSRWPLKTTRMVEPKARYEHKAVKDNHVWAANTKDTANDTAAANAHANAVAVTLGAEMGHGSFLLRHLSRQYDLGDGIPATSGRMLPFDLDARPSSPRVPIVVGITWTFGDNANKTELVLDSPLLSVT